MFKKIKNIFFRLKSTNIKAIYEDDLIKSLSDLGILEDIENKKYRCMICNTQINMENLQAVIPTKSGIKIICSNSACIGKYNSFIHIKS